MGTIEIGLGRAGLALINAVEGAAIAYVMLCRREHRGRAAELTLETAHHRFAVGTDLGRIGAVAFVGAAPARVLNHRHSRRDRPGDSGRPNLFGSSPADARHKSR